jgi:hypothetical protein
MSDLRAVIAAVVFALPAVSFAAEKKVFPPLAQDHFTISGALTFRTPAGWTVTNTPGEVERTEARGDGMILVVLRRRADFGLDNVHVDCMLERLAPPMETHPGVRYEYDFVGGEIGNRRALDSAFVVEYDKEIDGDTKWRQRNVTIVGQGESVCVIAHCRNSYWKKYSAARKLLTSVVESVRWP